MINVYVIRDTDPHKETPKILHIVSVKVKQLRWQVSFQKLISSILSLSSLISRPANESGVRLRNVRTEITEYCRNSIIHRSVYRQLPLSASAYFPEQRSIRN